MSISILKGRFENPSEVNEFVLSIKKNVTQNDFQKTQVVFRELKRDVLAWEVKLPADKFNPKVGDIYKLSAQFQPSTNVPPIGNVSSVVWA
jgi:hypothetical protein